jgi:hypothetical protein
MPNPAIMFTPRSHDYYERQWRAQRGAWAGPDVERGLMADVDAVVDVFRHKGAKAGLFEAHERGILDGARIYMQMRAATEEDLAVRVAALRAEQVRRPTPRNAVAIRFLEARLAEVRDAQKQGHTPAQAVADLPDVPRKQVPRWIPFVALGLSVIALLRR